MLMPHLPQSPIQAELANHLHVGQSWLFRAEEIWKPGPRAVCHADRPSARSAQPIASVGQWAAESLRQRGLVLNGNPLEDRVRRQLASLPWLREILKILGHK